MIYKTHTENIKKNKVKQLLHVLVFRIVFTLKVCNKCM